MESRVDFPQPEGPAMERYSPFLISQVDTGKGVRLHLVGVKDLGDAFQLNQSLTGTIRFVLHGVPGVASASELGSIFHLLGDDSSSQ